jgi:hypothetical protein
MIPSGLQLFWNGSHRIRGNRYTSSVKYLGHCRVWNPSIPPNCKRCRQFIVDVVGAYVINEHQEKSIKCNTHFLQGEVGWHPPCSLFAA